MEIAPIPGIRFMPMVQRTLVAGETAPVFDIDDLVSIGSGSYSAKHEESRGGMQNEADDLSADDEDEIAGPHYTRSGKSEVGRRLNCFA
jgi:hypothetical protein